MAKRHDEQTRMDGLMALAMYGGQAATAARELKRQGRPIPRPTLVRWRNQDPDAYLAARQAVRDRVVAKTSDIWRRAIHEAAEGVIEASAAARWAIAADDPGQAKVWAQTSRDLSVTAGVGDDKASRADGVPEVVEHRTSMTPEQVHRGLAKLGLKVVPMSGEEKWQAIHTPAVIESEAEEEVVEQLPGGTNVA